MRDTKQRFAIKRSLEESGRPLAPKEILEQASSYVPNLGIATVYRNIKVMLDSGELEPVEVPGQAPRYQPPNGGTHPRVVCTRCNRVFNIEGAISAPLPDQPNGFVIERKEIILYGTRTECINGQECPYR